VHSLDPIIVMTKVAAGVIFVVLEVRGFAILASDVRSDPSVTFRASHSAPLIEAKSLI
jgi:hypothetical protein